MPHNKPSVPPKPKRYPRWITLEDGNTMIVQNCQMHSTITGIEYDENAEPVVVQKPPIPPPLVQAPAPIAPAPLEAVAESVSALVDPLGMFTTEAELEPPAEEATESAEKPKRRGKAAKE